MTARKTVFVKERITAEAGSPAIKPISRIAAIAIIANPFAGRFVEDLSPLFNKALVLGEELMPQAAAMLDGPPIAYGKAAIVGVNGDLEHAAAVIHPTLGKPMRAALGGGESIIPHTSKVASAGTPIDVPLANKDNIWSFDDFETITVAVADAPRPDEIMIVMAIADSGRPHPRIGQGRAAT
ncbi:MAG: peptide synthetase [Rhodospirillaceae bacterium]|nr:peptide synthetase [Rhodospirillaceae bacterium]|tara:strand:- start:215 stop:760 length:546 start_codon:yes stop_codon:yes gene_type:complete